MIPTIEELRRKGYKVKVIHGFTEKDDNFHHLSDRKTTIYLKDLNDVEWMGVARCSKRDQYNRKLGNKIALGRVLKNAGIIE